MTLLDFAYLEGNMYTYEFAGAYACGQCNNIPWDDQYHLGCDGGTLPIHEYKMLRFAKAHLEAHVFPLILEQLDLRDLLALHNHLNYSSQMQLPGRLLPRLNTRKPSEATVSLSARVVDVELLHILSLDVALYNHAQSLARQWHTWLART